MIRKLVPTKWPNKPRLYNLQPQVAAVAICTSSGAFMPRRAASTSPSGRLCGEKENVRPLEPKQYDALIKAVTNCPTSVRNLHRWFIGVTHHQARFVRKVSGSGLGSSDRVRGFVRLNPFSSCLRIRACSDTSCSNEVVLCCPPGVVPASGSAGTQTSIPNRRRSGFGKMPRA